MTSEIIIIIIIIIIVVFKMGIAIMLMYFSANN